MAYDYSGLQGTAANLLDKFGRDATLLKLAPGEGYNPGDPVETLYAIRMVADQFKAMDKGGTLVEQTDQLFYFTSPDAEPATQDVILDGSKRFTIIGVDETRPGPPVIMYTCQVREG